METQVSNKLALIVGTIGAVIAVTFAIIEKANIFVIFASAVGGALFGVLLIFPIWLLLSPFFLFFKNRDAGYTPAGSMARSLGPLLLVVVGSIAVFGTAISGVDLSGYIGSVQKLLIPVGIGYALGSAIRHTFKKEAAPVRRVGAVLISFVICVLAILGYSIYAELALGATKQPAWVGFWSLLTGCMAYTGLRAGNKEVS